MLIMENSEEVMQILERFTKLKQKDIPKELEDYLCYVAKTGDTVYRWANIKYLFREKLVHVIKDFHDTTPSIDDLPQYPNVDPFNYETMKSSLLERLELFNAAPFTIQRLCELLTDPRKQYSRIDKFMRALEKNILVVSTIEPGRKQTESENGDSLDSVVNGDLSLDVNVDIDMESESIFSMEPQNTAATTPTSSSSSSYTKIVDDDLVASQPKKPKLDIGDDNNTEGGKTKASDSESDDASDDSDSSDSKEISREADANKAEIICQALANSLPAEKNDEDKENCEAIKTEQEAESTEKTIISSETEANEKPSLKSVEVSNSLDENLKNEAHSTSSTVSVQQQQQEPSSSSVTENLVGTTQIEEVEVSEKQTNEERSSAEENANVNKENEESVQPDSTDPCLKGLGKHETETVKVTSELQQNNPEYKESDVSSVTQSVLIVVPEGRNEQNTGVINDPTELISKDISNITSSYPECSEGLSSSSSSSSTSSSSSSNVIHKIPEQMSVEDATLTPTSAEATAAAVVLLPQELQQCSQQIPILSAAGSGIDSTTPNLIEEEIQQPQQQITDQPMDENLDAGISTCVAAVSTNSVVDSSGGVINEIIMQAESSDQQMATDIITKTPAADVKLDLSGMDVDDTSQEEAMDQ